MNEKKIKEKRKTGKLERKPKLVNLEKKTVERKGVFQRKKKKKDTVVGKLFTQKKGRGKK